MERHAATHIYATRTCKKQRQIKTSLIWPENPGASAKAAREEIPGVLLLQFLFQTGRAIILTAGVAEGVCAPFRSDLNKTFTLTDPAAIYEYQCHL